MTSPRLFYVQIDFLSYSSKWHKHQKATFSPSDEHNVENVYAMEVNEQPTTAKDPATTADSALGGEKPPQSTVWNKHSPRIAIVFSTLLYDYA